MMVYLTLDQCPNHPDTHSISVEASKEAGGIRLAGPKCCGRWVELQRWPVDSEEAVSAILSTAEDAELALEEEPER